MSFNSNNLLFITALAFVAVISCNNQSSSAQKLKDDSTTTAQKQQTAIIPFIDNRFNQAARFIAGLNQLNENEYSVWEKKPEWIAYKYQMDSTWEMLASTRFNVMEQFYEENWSAHRKNEGAVYYPFSGPDWLNIYQVYPHASSYVMAGLEPVGKIPNPMSMTKPNELSKNLNGFYNGFRTIKEWGYYVTSYMQKDLNLTKLKGVIPIDYLFMIRMGCAIENVELLSLDSTGKALVVAEFPLDKINMHGCRITFRHKDNKPGVLTYFEGNLEDVDSKAYGHSYIKNYGNYVRANVKNANSYLKAASYLLYSKTFINSLHLLLDVSKTMLADESGVPYDKIDRSKWDITLYGTYRKPIKYFTWISQPELKRAYEKDSSSIKQIPFFTGYHREIGQSNLQFYIKK